MIRQTIYRETFTPGITMEVILHERGGYEPDTFDTPGGWTAVGDSKIVSAEMNIAGKVINLLDGLDPADYLGSMMTKKPDLWKAIDTFIEGAPVEDGVLA